MGYHQVPVLACQVQVVVQLVLAVISFNHSSDTTGRDGLYRSAPRRVW